MGRKLRTGLTSETKKNLVLGEGAIFKNFVVGTDTYESAISAGKLLGATQGGSEFKATASVRNIEVDGIPGKVADLDLIESWEVTLQTSFLEVTVDTIKAALGAASSTASAEEGFTKITGKNEFTEGDYFENITFIGTLSGNDNPIILQVLNAIGSGEFDIKVQNGQESTVDCTFNGRYSIDTLDQAPFAIWYPDAV